MCKLEKNLNKIGGIIGIILLTSIIMAMSSCICGQEDPVTPHHPEVEIECENCDEIN
tara:strand:+ start:165 stop:335 length:171 start_codon:yes stop_codon:yes gene_type:complete